MELIRKYKKFELLYEPLQRMYRVTDGYDVSFWFNWETMLNLLELSDFEFKKECERMLLNSSFVL